MHIPPEQVISPRSRVGEVLEVIHDPGAGHMAVARIRWDGDPVIAIRWNGNDEQPLGNPVSRGRPTWVVVEGYAAEEVERAAREAAEQTPNSLTARYREMAADREREQEAEEWSEGLIGDVSTPR